MAQMQSSNRNIAATQIRRVLFLLVCSERQAHLVASSPVAALRDSIFRGGTSGGTYDMYAYILHISARCGRAPCIVGANADVGMKRRDAFPDALRHCYRRLPRTFPLSFPLLSPPRLPEPAHFIRGPSLCI